MDTYFEINKDQNNLKNEVRKVASQFLTKLNEWEEKGLAPIALFRELGKRRWMGPVVPEEYDGMGKGAIEYSVITEELSRLGFFGPQTSVQAEKSLLASGTSEQKLKYLPKLANGEFIASIAISEPAAGANWEMMETKAEKSGNDYIITGIKSHINFAAEANLSLVYAKTQKGLSIFLIDGSTPGILAKKGNPIGLRMEPIYEVTLDKCKVPASNLLGEEGKASSTFFAAFNLSRIGNASRLIGISKGALDAAVSYAKERQVGNNKVTDFQGIRWLVADLITKIEAASCLRDKAAWLHDRGVEHAVETAVAKLFASEISQEVALKVFSLVGAWGCYRDKPFERFLRDAKVGQFGGGSSEVLRNFIARQFLGKVTSV